MTLERECSKCGALYSVVFAFIEDTTDWPDDCENAPEDGDRPPEASYCPFCGMHESIDPDDYVNEFEELDSSQR